MKLTNGKKVRVIIEGVQVFTTFGGLPLGLQEKVREVAASGHAGYGRGFVIQYGSQGANVQVDWN